MTGKQGKKFAGWGIFQKTSLFQVLRESMATQVDYTGIYKTLILLPFSAKRPHSKSISARSAGSIPARGTTDHRQKIQTEESTDALFLCARLPY